MSHALAAKAVRTCLLAVTLTAVAAQAVAEVRAVPRWNCEIGHPSAPPDPRLACRDASGNARQSCLRTARPLVRQWEAAFATYLSQYGARQCLFAYEVRDLQTAMQTLNLYAGPIDGQPTVALWAGMQRLKREEGLPTPLSMTPAFLQDVERVIAARRAEQSNRVVYSALALMLGAVMFGGGSSGSGDGAPRRHPGCSKPGTAAYVYAQSNMLC